MDYIITTEKLTKKYKNFTSVSNVSLHVRKGSIYGFLGPTGGKIHYHEDAAGAVRTRKRQLHH
jgi:ABC-type lipopolysaccharide export system ATPase subunit